ncbi:hypothetical protein PCE1_004867 [Barthelona sp. PCE]
MELREAMTMPANEAVDIEVHEFGEYDVAALTSVFATPQDPETTEKNLAALGSTEELMAGLKTSPLGLSGDELKEENIAKRVASFGENVVPVRQGKTFWDLFVEALNDHTLIILIVAAIISLVLGLWEDPTSGWIEGLAILIAVLIVTVVTAGNDYSKEKQFRKLSAIAAVHEIMVMRDGRPTPLKNVDLVVGDVIIAQHGKTIECDGIVIETTEGKISEKNLTGEPNLVRKEPEAGNGSIVWASTLVGHGSVNFLVLAVAPNTYNQRLRDKMKKMSEETSETPLQIKLAKAADTIGYIGFGAATLVMIALYIRWFIEIINDRVEFKWSGVIHPIIEAVVIVVVAVPEGLPLAVTIALAYSMLKMLKDRNLVRKLEACETMGGATQIVSDKTGTLTLGEMRVEKVWNSEMLSNEQITDDLEWLMITNMISNSNATLEKNKHDKLEVKGNFTEGALLFKSLEMGVEDYFAYRQENKPVTQWPFNSLVKRMDTVVHHGEEFALLSKGASEVLLKDCNRVLSPDGTIVELTEEYRTKANEAIDEMTSNGLRTLTLSYLPMDGDRVREIQHQDDNPVSNEMILLCVLGIVDPLRPEVKGAVATATKAGIVVRMATGDNIKTATYIAKEAGIFKKDSIALEGKDLTKIIQEGPDTPEKWEKINRVTVVARCSPEDKLEFVEYLISRREVVACSGDGTNDALILSRSDVGFAMGIAGSDVAKDASDIIIQDDNFASMVKAVRWGRNVYDSIRKFLQFQLTVNLVALTVAFVGSVSGNGSPLKATQLLWVNLIMDTLAALALSTEPPSDALLERKPYGRSESLIAPTMWRNIIVGTIYQLVVEFVLLYNVDILFPDVVPNSAEHYTIIFNIFVFLQIFNELPSRRAYNELNFMAGFFTNWIFIGVLVFTVGMQILMVQFFGDFASTVPLKFDYWLKCVYVSAPILLVSWISRFIKLPTSSISSVYEQEEEETRKARMKEFAEDVRPTSRENWRKLARAIQTAHAFGAYKKPEAHTTSIVEKVRRPYPM